MADTSGMADIRGIDIDKLAKGYAEEEYIFKNLCTVTPTSAREIRWYQKTAGTLDSSTDTTGITASHIANQAYRALPVTVEPSWTRQTSYVRKYIVESPLISDEDIRDSDVDILQTSMRDLTREVVAQVDTRIYNVLTESDTPVNVNTNASTAAWDSASGQDPIEDIAEGLYNIQTYRYSTANAVMILNPANYKALLVWLISTKGTSLPNFSSELAQNAELTRILGVRIIVSNNVTDNYATIFIPQRSVTWKSFVPTTARSIEEVGLGVKIRVWEEGEALLTDPRSVNVITAV